MNDEDMRWISTACMTVMNCNASVREAMDALSMVEPDRMDDGEAETYADVIVEMSSLTSIVEQSVGRLADMMTEMVVDGEISDS